MPFWAFKLLDLFETRTADFHEAKDLKDDAE
jgi:hypothetical protein